LIPRKSKKRFRSERFWAKIFGLKIGDHVKVAQIFSPGRLEEYPKLSNFIGQTGVITSKGIGWSNTLGLWVSSESIDPNAEKRTKVNIFRVQFDKPSYENYTDWIFEERDLELLESEENESR